MNAGLSIAIGIGVTRPTATSGGEVPDGALFIDDAESSEYFTDDALANPLVTKD